MRSKLRRTFAAILLALPVAAALVYAFWPRPVAVDLGEVSRGPMRVTVDHEGWTQVKESYVVSAPVAGQLLRIERRAGDVVTAGETVLAVIRPSDPTFLDVRSRRQAETEVRAAEAAKALAKAELARTRAESAFAGADLERARRLAAGDTISQRALDRAELESETRRAALEAAEAALRVRSFELETAQASLIEPGLDDAANRDANCCVRVRAPVSGRVLKLIQESASVVAAGTPLLEIGDPQDLEIVVDLLTTDAVRVREGATVSIVGWGGARALQGRVRRIEPYGYTKVSALGIEEQRVNAIIDLTSPADAWRQLAHGYRVETRITVWQADEVLRLPVGALFREGPDWAVFVADDDGRARLVRVEIGHANGVVAEVLGGLAEGVRVLLHPSDRIAEGVRVTPRSEG